MPKTRAHRGWSLRVACGLIPFVLVTGPAAPARAQLPGTRLFAVFPPGAKQGTTVDVSLTSGADLDDIQMLFFSHGGIKVATPDAAGQNKSAENTFHVVVDPDVPPGRYEVRALGRFGVSNPRSFTVSDRPEIIETEPNNFSQQAQSLSQEVVVNGQCEEGHDADFYGFDLAAGQRLRLECWAERIDSRMDATLVLFGPDGQELANSRDFEGRDPLLDYTAPREGRYVAKVYDFLYRNGKEYVYRLYAGLAPRIDFIFPPVGQAGRLQSFTLFGRNLPDGRKAVDVSIAGVALEKRQVDVTLPAANSSADATAAEHLFRLVDAPSEHVAFRLPSPAGVSNSVLIGLTTEHVVIEHEPNNQPEAAQRITVPCEFVGQFASRGDRDWMTLDAVKDEQFWIEVCSHHHGLASDPFVVLQRVAPQPDGRDQTVDVTELDDSTGASWANSWNAPREDPIFQFKAPESGTYRLMIRDLYADARGSPHLVYRLAIRRPRPDFQLVAIPYRERPKNESDFEPAAPLVRPGGAVGISVFAIRRDGFNGPVELSVEGLPDQVHSDPAVLGPGVDATMLIVRAQPDASAWCGPIRVRGKATIEGGDLARQAATATVTWPAPGQGQNRRPTRLTQDMFLAISGHEKERCAVSLGDQPLVEAQQSGKVILPVKVTRLPEASEPITLSPHFLPPDVKAQEVTIPGDKGEGQIELELANNAPVGEFAISLVARTQLDYRRNQQAVDEANHLLAETKHAASAAAAAAETTLAAQQETAGACEVAARRLDETSQLLARFEIEHRGAKAHADAMRVLHELAEAAAQQQSQNEPLAAAVEFAKRVSDEADKNGTEVEASLAAARQALEEARAADENTRSTLGTASAAAQQAAEGRKAADEALAAAEKRANEVAEANKPQRTDVALTSNSIRLRIKAAPQSGQ